MNTPRSCGCKGQRTCLDCENQFNLPQTAETFKKLALEKFLYCPLCNLCYPIEKNTDSELNSYKLHPNHRGNARKFDGLFVKLDFLSDIEQSQLISGIDSMPWELSQSGRRKQNFGPKCNFKGRKLRLGEFRGFPAFTKFVQDKFSEIPIMKDFQTIEQCSLEYDPKRGASIDPHVDDCWVWGERVVTVNLLSDSVLILTPNENPTKYNLDLIHSYSSVVVGDLIEPRNNDDEELKYIENAAIFVPMPKNSLIIMYGRARYEFEHRILREDIRDRRVCIAYREFTPIFLEGGKNSKEGKLIIEKAQQFFF